MPVVVQPFANGESSNPGFTGVIAAWQGRMSAISAVNRRFMILCDGWIGKRRNNRRSMATPDSGK